MGRKKVGSKGARAGVTTGVMESEYQPLTSGRDLSASASGTASEQGSARAQCGKSRVVRAFISSALAGALFGYDIGSTAVVTTEDQALGDFDIPKNSWQQGALVSVSLYGALLASLILFALGEVLGRKQEVLLANVLYMVGSVGSVLPKAHTSYGIAIVIASRFLYGTGVGLTMHSAPSYISEMAPTHWRGLLIALKETLIVLGILLGYLMGYLFDVPRGWRVIWGSGALVALVSFLGMCFQPESPRWLASRDQTKALESLRYFRGLETSSSSSSSSLDRDVDEEFRGILSALDSEGKEGGGGSRLSISLWKKVKEVWQAKKAFVIGGGLLFFQQVSGQPAVLYFAPTIFSNAGLGAQTSKLASVLVGVVKLVATTIASFNVDSFGRRPLLLWGIGFMFLSLAALSLTSVWQSVLASKLIIAELMLLVTAYQIGFGPISWLILTEVCPLRVRGNMVGLGVSTNFAFNVVATSTLPVLSNALGMSGLFGIYSIVAVLSFIFVYSFVPETKGKTLEEIEVSLGLVAAKHDGSLG